MPTINKCDHCGRPFGMIRHRWWSQQYCRRVCYDIAASQREHIRTFLRKLVEVPGGKPPTSSPAQ
jgi:ribosomal protein S14